MKKPKEIELKRWLYEESLRLNLKPATLRRRMDRGDHPWPVMRRVNARVCFVQVN